MSKVDFPPIQHACQAFRYEDGILYWKPRPWGDIPGDDGWKYFNKRYAGKPAGCRMFTGADFRCVIRFGNRQIFRYTIVWVLHNNVWRLWLDHKDRDSLNDRIENLRECKNYKNMCNAKIVSSNTSGFKGIFWEEAKGKWSARIRANGKRTRLGLFDTREEAHAAYMQAARELHGEFASDGKPSS